jgi:hypothetical protein
MSASGGKADIPDTPHQYPLMTVDRTGLNSFSAQDELISVV